MPKSSLNKDMEEKGIDWPEAMRIFYSSKTYEKLYDDETGLYLESSVYVFDILTGELKYEKNIQNSFEIMQATGDDAK